MNRKTMSVLAVALTCGVGAMVASSRMMAGPAAPPPVEMVEILVAARDLNTEETLKPDMFKKAAVPKETAPAGSFLEAKEVEDRWVQIRILEGEAIVERKLAPRGTPTGLVARIPRGKRAFALNVNEQSGVSGFILPDHHVDVIQVRPAVAPGGPGGGGSEGPLGETVLEDLLVLASGTTFVSPTDRSIQSKTVTLAVTPAEAETLTAAQSRGQLSLALRGLNDHDRAPAVPRPTPAPPPVVVASAPPPPPPPAPEPKAEPKPEPRPEPPVEKTPRLVMIYRGGRPPEPVRLGGESSGLEPNDNDDALTTPSRSKSDRL
jgi:pilus assembly protein CpaB